MDVSSSSSANSKSDSPLVAVIFTGKGESFCAGADLSNPPDPIAQSSDLKCCLAGNPVYQMSRIGVPIIGAVKGYVSCSYSFIASAFVSFCICRVELIPLKS